MFDERREFVLIFPAPNIFRERDDVENVILYDRAVLISTERRLEIDVPSFEVPLVIPEEPERMSRAGRGQGEEMSSAGDGIAKFQRLTGHPPYALRHGNSPADGGTSQRRVAPRRARMGVKREKPVAILDHGYRAKNEQVSVQPQILLKYPASRLPAEVFGRV